MTDQFFAVVTLIGKNSLHPQPRHILWGFSIPLLAHADDEQYTVNYTAFGCMV